MKYLLIPVLLISISCTPSNKADETNSKALIANLSLERFRVSNGNLDSLSLMTKIVKEFDENGVELKSTYYTPENEKQIEFRNTYDNDLKVRVDWINARDTMIRYVKMFYNEDERMVRSEAYNPADSFLSGYMHNWLEDGRVEQKGPIPQEGESFKYNAIYIYTDQNEYDSLKEFDENDSLYYIATWKYIEIDSQQNWTERQMIVRDTVRRIERRKITYKN